MSDAAKDVGICKRACLAIYDHAGFGHAGFTTTLAAREGTPE